MLEEALPTHAGGGGHHHGLTRAELEGEHRPVALGEERDPSVNRLPKEVEAAED